MTNSLTKQKQFHAKTTSPNPELNDKIYPDYSQKYLQVLLW